MALFSTLKNGFRSITFEKISELDLYFIHKHIMSYSPFSTLKNSFSLISFENSVLNSYLTHRYIIIK